MIDYDKIVSERAREIKPSGIRKFFDIAQQMTGVLNLGVGEPDFFTPWKIRQQAISVLEKIKTSYTANSGLMDLRRSISGYLGRTIGVDYKPENEIIVTVGGSEAIDLAIRALVDEGDEVLIVEPCFVCYAPMVELSHGVPVTVETSIENSFKLTAEALRAKITPRTKALILPYPNNPTGAIMTKEELEPIAEVLRGTDIIVISDEIYSALTYGREHFSIAALDGMRERTLVINGFSKGYAMTGWRLGFLAGPQPILKHILKIHQYAIMSSPTVSQYAAITALEECDDDVAKMVEEYDVRRRYVVNAFNKIGLPCFDPEGAFYAFPCIKSTGLTSQQFSERLVYEKKVAVVPGDAFGKCGEGYIRVSYAYSLKNLKAAVKLIEEFLEDLKKEHGDE